MRGHMPRVMRFGSNQGVAPRGRQRENGMLRIAKRVDYVVRRARMVGLFLEHIQSHRLAPISHHESGFNFGRLTKCVECLFVPEGMKSGHSAQEMRLCLLRSGSRKINLAQTRLLRLYA